MHLVTAVRRFASHARCPHVFLQDAAPWLFGSAFWYAPLPVDGAWSVSATLVVIAGANGAADGVTFVVQTDSRGVRALGDSTGSSLAVRHIPIELNANRSFHTSTALQCVAPTPHPYPPRPHAHFPLDFPTLNQFFAAVDEHITFRRHCAAYIRHQFWRSWFRLAVTGRQWHDSSSYCCLHDERRRKSSTC